MRSPVTSPSWEARVPAALALTTTTSSGEAASKTTSAVMTLVMLAMGRRTFAFFAYST
jgi:hypothetical protein